jgi:subtilisin family serine protease
MSSIGVEVKHPAEIWHLRSAESPPIGINLPSRSTPDVVDPPIHVAIVDTGFELEHPSLEGQFARKHARDFDHDLDQGRSLADGGVLTNPHDAHGTALAGIVAAKPVEASAFVGVAPASRIVPIRISTNFEAKALASALRHAVDCADVILLARFLPHEDELTAVLDRIASDKPVICASGNDGLGVLIFPASHPRTIAVGACNELGYRSTYSQYGDGLDLVAPSNDLPCEDRELVRLDWAEAKRRKAEVKLWMEQLASRVRTIQCEVEMLCSAVEQIRCEMGKQPEWMAPEMKAKLEHMVLLERTARETLDRTERAFVLAKHRAEACEGPSGSYHNSNSGARWNEDRLGVLSIATTDNLGAFGYNYDPIGDYCKAHGQFGFGGTSAAAAQVAGVVALMLAANPRLKTRPDAIKNILRETANRNALTSEEGGDRTSEREFGAGLVDATKAIEVARTYG